MSSRLKVIVALGNPGKEYENNRHNLGFKILDRFQSHIGSGEYELTAGSLISKGEYSGFKYLLCKPMGYMNNSGQSLAQTLSYLKLRSYSLLLLYDELDIPLGKYKLVQRKERKISHRGVRDLELTLPNIEFLKLKLGIRPKEEKKLTIREFVMEDFTSQELMVLSQIEGEIFTLIKRFISLSEEELKVPINFLKR